MRRPHSVSQPLRRHPTAQSSSATTVEHRNQYQSLEARSLTPIDPSHLLPSVDGNLRSSEFPWSGADQAPSSRRGVLSRETQIAAGSQRRETDVRQPIARCGATLLLSSTETGTRSGSLLRAEARPGKPLKLRPLERFPNPQKPGGTLQIPERDSGCATQAPKHPHSVYLDLLGVPSRTIHDAAHETVMPIYPTAESLKWD